MPEDTRRGSRGSLQRPSRWSSPENSKASSDFLVNTILILAPEASIMASASGQCSHLAVGEVEVVTHLHGQRALAAAAEAHDAVLAASVRHVVNCEYSLTSRVCLRETDNLRSKSCKRYEEAHVCEGVLTTMSRKLSVLGLLLSVLWISSLCRLIPLTFTSWTCLETSSNHGNTDNIQSTCRMVCIPGVPELTYFQFGSV